MTKLKRYMNYTAIYLLLCVCFFQFLLHLPLSYLTKKWFWTTPESVQSIHMVLKKLPPDVSVMTQANIITHESHRDEALIMWPNTKDFKQNSPCGKLNCIW